MWRIDQFFPENENRMLHAPINLFYRMDWMASISTIPKALLIYKQCIAMVWRIIPWVICFFWSNMGMIFWDLAFYFISHFAFYWTPMVNIFWWTSYGEHFMVNILWWTFYGEHLMVNWTSCARQLYELHCHWGTTSIEHYEILVTLEICDQSDEETGFDHQKYKNNDKDNYKNKYSAMVQSFQTKKLASKGLVNIETLLHWHWHSRTTM